MKAKSPMDIYKLLPRTNCGECGENTCMAFAAKVMDRSLKIEACKPLVEEEKYKKTYEELKELTRPEIREVEIGVGDRKVVIGGQDVMRRHDLTFYNKCALFYDVWDTLDDKELEFRVKWITSWGKFYVGRVLTVDGIAVRSVSKDKEKFAECVKKVSEMAPDWPLILCSYEPSVLEGGLEVVGDKNPLVYAATKDNWREVAKLMDKYPVPLTLSAPNNLDMLKSLAVTFLKRGKEDLVLDPGTYPTGKGLQKTLSNFIRLRQAGILEGQREVAFPLMAIPMTAWMVYDDPKEASYWEAINATTFIVRYGDIMIQHSLAPHNIGTSVILDFNIYTDPRRPVAVEPGLRVIGNPNEESPLFITSNFALTYYTVESDISNSGIDCWLLVIDTDGLGVEAGVAGGQFSPDRIKDAFEKFEVEKKVKQKYKTLILPGLAARLSGDTEDATGWKVLVGCKDSGMIPRWMEDYWPPRE
ncbi:MAG: acetyl-CoA decarbonylase/synthase complex subunit gamma [Candidatus Methanospirareceae archaeon]